MKYLMLVLCLSLTACGETSLSRKCDKAVDGYSQCTTTFIEPAVACEGSCKK